MQRIHHQKANRLFGIGLVILVLLQFWFPLLDTGDTYGTHSTATKGKKAFYLFLDQQGYYPYRSDEKLTSVVDSLYSDSALLMLGPGRTPSKYEWDELLNWARNGGSVLIAASSQKPELHIPQLGIEVVSYAKPKEDDSPLNSNPVSFASSTPKPKMFSDLYSPLYSSKKLAWPKLSEIKLTSSSQIRAKILVECEKTIQAVEMIHQRGRIVVLANDSLFTNESLLNTDNAILANQFIESLLPSPDSDICIDEWLNATSVPKVVGLLLSPLFRGFTLLVISGFWLFLWSNWFRFGPYLPREEDNRQNIVSHTDSLGTLYYQGKQGCFALNGYWRQLQRELRWSRNKQQQERLTSLLVRRTNYSAEEIRQLFYRVEAACENLNLSRTDSGDLIEQLAKLRAAYFV